MKTALHPCWRGRQGHVLIVTMVFGAIVGLILLSYLQLIQARTKIRARSQAWNQAIPVLEQGIEEAFTHLHNDYFLSSNKWTVVGTNSTLTYRRSRTNSDTSYFIVTISNATSYPYNRPIIYSQGFVPAPLGQGFISRLVRVDATNSVTFTKAISAKGSVDLNGQTIVDSFDSSNTNYSTGGLYDVAKRKANGGVATNSRNSPAVDAGNGHIYGTVGTGPGGTVTTTAGGTVGDLAWSSGIEPGYTTDDMNVSFPDQTAPANTSGWVAPVAGTYTYGATNDYTWMIGDENKMVSGDFSMNSNDKMAITGNATLYVTGNFKMNGNAVIYIAPGAKFNLYVGGSTTTFTGGGVFNATGLASNFSYYGLPGNTTIKYAGNANFIGTINAPQADFTITGGAQVSGAAIVNSYTSKSAGAALHYDESLSGPGQLKLIAYREL